jgi:hypothetical protein
MPANLRKYYKRSRKLILTRYEKLKDENKKACDLMLLYNDDLRLAHYLKEWFYEICQSEKYSYQRTAFWDWVKTKIPYKNYTLLYLKKVTRQELLNMPRNINYRSKH